jgi:hypothetical protein
MAEVRPTQHSQGMLMLVTRRSLFVEDLAHAPRTAQRIPQLSGFLLLRSVLQELFDFALQSARTLQTDSATSQEIVEVRFVLL